MAKLIDLIRQLDTGDIVLPEMQRDYVWRPPKVEKLLESLYKGYPVGSFFLWRPSKKQPIKDQHPHKPASGEPSKYLLDGQQRLVSLSRSMKDASNDILLPRPGRESQPMSWRGFFDIHKSTFILKGHKKGFESRIEHTDPSLIALSDLIQMDDQTGLEGTSKITEAVRRLVDEGHIDDTDAAKDDARTKLQRVKSMLEADVPCQEIETAKLASTDSDEVTVAIDIFGRLNSGGVNLSRADVEAAWLAQETTSSILGPVRAYARRRACVALGLNFNFLTRALAMIRHGTARFSKLPKNWASGAPDIERSWADTEIALNFCIDLVERVGWTSRRWLPSTSALLPVAYFVHKRGGHVSKAEHPEVARFLCLAAWTGAFSKASETAIDHYLRPLTKMGKGSPAKILTDAIPRTGPHKARKVMEDDVLYERAMTGSLMQIYLAYLVARRSASWPSGELLADASKMADGKRGLEVHHIFPRKFVEHVEGYVEGYIDVNTMGNYAILTRADNAFLADEDPKVAYGRLTVDQKRFAKAQLIPFGDVDALVPEAYAAFTKHRAKELTNALNGFLGL